MFPGRWIGRRGFVDWPIHSPNLTPLNFFLMLIYVKSEVSQIELTTSDEMKRKIIIACCNILPNILAEVEMSFRERIKMCINTRIWIMNFCF